MRKLLHVLFSPVTLCLFAIAVQITAVVFLCLYVQTLLPVCLAVGSLWLLNACAVGRIYATFAPPEMTAGKLTLCLLLPVFGAILGLIRPSLHRLPPIYALNTQNSTFETTCYFAEATDFYASLFADLEGAKERIDLLFFILADGVILDELLIRLKQAQARGVSVNVSYDDFGSAFKLRPKRLRDLKKLGVNVKRFHRLRPLFERKLNFRDHRKLAVIDGEIAYVSGANVGDEYANRRHPYGYWKDTAVRVTGEGVTAIKDITESYFLGKTKTAYGNVITDCAPSDRTLMEEELLRAICGAKERVWIMTPYLIPTSPLLCAVCGAVRHGVDVRVLIPGTPDKPYAYCVSREHGRRLLPYGVPVRTFTPGFLHAKNVLCDETLFCGSYNFDLRSLYLNYECDVRLTDEGAVSQAQNDFLNCWALSEPLPEKPTLKERIATFFVRPFAPLF